MYKIIDVTVVAVLYLQGSKFFRATALQITACELCNDDLYTQSRVVFPGQTTTHCVYNYVPDFFFIVEVD